MARCADYDIFHEFDYIKEIGDSGGRGEPEAIWFENNKGGKLFYPYLRRPLDMPWIPAEFKSYFDICSPFGAGGYLIDGDIEGFAEEWVAFVSKENIIAEFIRHDPFFSRPIIGNGSDLHISDFVWINLREFPSEDVLFRSFRKGHKSDIKYAQKHLETREIAIIDFEALFSEFAQKRNLERLFAGFENFKSARTVNKQQFILGVFEKGRLITASFFLLSKSICHYLFAGKTEDFRGAYSLLLWEAIKRTMDIKNITYFSFGGAPVDHSSFVFKRGFSHNTAPYIISKHIHNKQIYAACVEAAHIHLGNTSSLFPAYRWFV